FAKTVAVIIGIMLLGVSDITVGHNIGVEEVYAATAFTYNGINYEVLNDGESCKVVAGSYTGDIIIPVKALSNGGRGKGYNVTEIGSSAFLNREDLTSVTIPQSVTSIGASAFKECSGLKNIILPCGVTNIGNNAFDSCVALTDVTLPMAAKDATIEETAFDNCVNITDVYLYVNSSNTVYDSLLKSFEIGACGKTNELKIHIRESCYNDYMEEQKYASGYLKGLKSKIVSDLNSANDIKRYGELIENQCYYVFGNKDDGTDNDINSTYIVYAVDKDSVVGTDYIEIQDPEGMAMTKINGEALKLYKVYNNIMFPDGSVLNAEELTGADNKYIVAVKLDGVVIPNTDKFRFVQIGS
ncbi:MAG: leucine-rich repeat domain-containing protein, partial [Firmicutes bacterium]|nr:leucine-rich repeat domain-containing protein [Bacillota bacterium]